MAGRVRNLLGQRFGRLMVEERLPSIKGHSHWRCTCDCGETTSPETNQLLSGKTQSCGCLQRERASLNQGGLTHGQHKTRVYTIYHAMKKRCENPKDHKFPRYGGRGIKICSEWSSFELFLAWAIPAGYADNLSIERRNNDGNYCPENCYWATPTQQASNRSSSRLLTINGRTQTIAMWAREAGMPYHTIWGRLRKGWTSEAAVNMKGKQNGPVDSRSSP